MVKKKDEYVRICPRCGSDDIVNEPGFSILGWEALFKCRKCNYAASNIPEVKKEDYASAKKKIMANTKFDANPEIKPVNKKTELISYTVVVAILILILIALSFSYQDIMLIFVLLIAFLLTYYGTWVYKNFKSKKK